ncbi:MAG: hypothetical protein RR075_03050, partial [Pygmaiobacter sp.]
HLLEQLERHNVRGATILSSRGMAMALENYMDGSFLGSLRAVMEPGREENRTILMALSNEQIPIALEVIDEIIDLDKPNSGIVFTLPIDYIKGVK